MQGGQVVTVGRGVAGVGNDADDGAAQRGALQQPAAHQLHVARRVHARPHGRAGQQDAFMGEQQRQAAGDLDGAARRHGRLSAPQSPAPLRAPGRFRLGLGSARRSPPSTAIPAHSGTLPGAAPTAAPTADFKIPWVTARAQLRTAAAATSRWQAST